MSRIAGKVWGPLLRLLAGFEYPTPHHLSIDGTNITALPPDKRPTNMVFQNLV